MKSPYSDVRGTLFIYWIPALIVSVLFSPVEGLVITSLILGGGHGYILLAVTQRNPFFYIGYAVIDFIVVWILPAAIGQLNCWFQFSPFGPPCIDGYFNYSFIVLSAAGSGAIMIFVYITSFFGD